MEEQQTTIREFINGKIQMLINRRDPSYTRATLAKLRRGVGKHPGSLPDVWDFTLDGMPQNFMSRNGETTPEQWAAYLTLTMFALHQQGKDINVNPMSVYGNSLGDAVRVLRMKRGEEATDAVKRRFDIVVTSNSAEELAYHIRSLISMLKSESIPLDYPRLADDILKFQSISKRDGVRLRWGQDYYMSTRKDDVKNDE